ncbi:aldehyde dehydrogenase family protein [Microbacterium murale]|uniref:Acyl-CoA reductase-like NAD-dependent aldehyde dehydrogenase n=1 Tax=Microbacterium murale TaxID=1081040 RepID=A0ABU0PBJ1_9MICO|nr:aldehyde dehydrogenase family protein [Microbacterium murale]MDQ0644708.1 acyl-CoA reductase-like NAD-dependent aldehyde dehydrogenase [Microbacterium murale]
MTITALRHFIDGAWTEGSGEPLIDVNPSRPDDIVAEGAGASNEDVARAFDAARAAFDGWRRTPARSRAAILLRAADIIDAHRDEWGRELAREEGKTLAEAIAETGHSANILRFHAQEADRASGSVFESPTPGERILVVRRPVGVIGAITPFNFPISIPAWKLAPALVWGNTIVWKAATFVPLLAMRFAQALKEAGLPKGVLNLVNGAAAVGEAIVSHPDVDAVTFTGSTKVGRLIAAELAARGVPFQGEMGGKNASLVLADADLDVAVEQVAIGAFRAAGQKCTATSRVIVHHDVAEEFLRRLAERTQRMDVGDALADGVEVGPVVDAVARDRVVAALGRAKAYATPVYAPEPYQDGALADGFFVPPSIFELSDDAPGELWSEELFGPVVGVRRVASAAEGIALVNDSEYGLSTAVFTTNLAHALAAIEDIRVGVVHINSASAGADLHVPFGGSGASALGPKEQGAAARDFFTETATVYLQG